VKYFVSVLKVKILIFILFFFLMNLGTLYPGDSAIAAAMLSYSGAFVASFRTELETLWR